MQLAEMSVGRFSYPPDDPRGAKFVGNPDRAGDAWPQSCRSRGR